MRKIAFPELQTWCTESRYNLNNWIPSLTSHADSIQTKLTVPQGVQALTELVDDLVHLDDHASELLVWIQGWNIWNERSEEIGLRQLALITAAAEGREENPEGHIYRLPCFEWSDAIALLLVPILYSWDAHLFFGSGRALIDTSHHDIVTIWFSQADQQIAAKLEPWKAT